MAALGLGACCLLGLAWVLGRLNLANLRVSMDGPASVPAGVVFPAVLTLRNQRGFWDAFAIQMELELPGKTRAGGHARWLAARTATDLELRVAVPVRAFIETHPVRLLSEFPMGLFEMRRVLLLAHSLVVFPRVVAPEGRRSASHAACGPGNPAIRPAGLIGRTPSAHGRTEPAWWCGRPTRRDFIRGAAWCCFIRSARTAV
jgi:uncharacterized protein (DUF58 family)